MRDERFPDHVRESSAWHGVPHYSIRCEITETAAANPERLARFIGQLHEQGCRFSLDGFEVGTSSFARLKRPPVDCLEIDRTFIAKLLVDPIDRPTVQVIDDSNPMDNRTHAGFV